MTERTSSGGVSRWVACCRSLRLPVPCKSSADTAPQHRGVADVFRLRFRSAWPSRFAGQPIAASGRAQTACSGSAAGPAGARPRPAPLPAPLAAPPKPSDLRLDRSRDELLTDFGKPTLSDRYLLAGESYQDMFARVSCAFADDVAHAQRLYDYMSQLWFMPATPVLSNGGTTRGLPISCFLNSVSDSLDGIVGTWNENVWLASNGGGIGTYWGEVRSIGEKVKGAARPPASSRSST